MQKQTKTPLAFFAFSANVGIYMHKERTVEVGSVSFTPVPAANWGSFTISVPGVINAAGGELVNQTCKYCTRSLNVEYHFFVQFCAFLSWVVISVFSGGFRSWGLSTEAASSHQTLKRPYLGVEAYLANVAGDDRPFCLDNRWAEGVRHHSLLDGVHLRRDKPEVTSKIQLHKGNFRRRCSSFLQSTERWSGWGEVFEEKLRWETAGVAEGGRCKMRRWIKEGAMIWCRQDDVWFFSSPAVFICF